MTMRLLMIMMMMMGGNGGDEEFSYGDDGDGDDEW